MKNDLGNVIKKVLAGMLLVCLLLTEGYVSSEPGIMPCGEEVSEYNQKN